MPTVDHSSQNETQSARANDRSLQFGHVFSRRSGLSIISRLPLDPPPPQRKTRFGERVGTNYTVP